MAGPLRVLVTGAGGFIGRAVLARCPADWNVIAMSRQPLEAPGAHIAVVAPPRPDEPLDERLARGFDATIHLAGNANHGLADAAPWEDLAATGVFAASILGRIPSRRIVLLSSAAVYAGLSGRADPDACLRPTMPYALSKLYVEGFVDSLVASGRTEGALIVRLFNAFGPGERPGRLIPRVVAAARSDGMFRLTGDPSSLSDPVHVDDVATCVIAAAGSSATGTYDLCGGNPVGLERQIARIVQALDLRALRIVHEPRPGEVAIQFYGDPRPLCERLEVARPESFELAVRRYASAVGWINSA